MTTLILILTFAIVAVLVASAAVTFCFYACWYYEARNFPEAAQLPNEPVELSFVDKGKSCMHSGCNTATAEALVRSEGSLGSTS